MVSLLVIILLTVSPTIQASRFKFKQIASIKQQPMREQVLRLEQAIPASGDKILFIPNYEAVTKITPRVETLQGETSMYSATPEFALKHGGPLTAEFLASVPDWYYNTAKQLGLYPNIDMRVHRLDFSELPAGVDLYPAIPGWHADGEYRETYFSQPDLTRVPVSYHVIATISTEANGVSNTQFLDQAIEMEIGDEQASTSDDPVLGRFRPPRDMNKTSDIANADIALWSNVHRYVESLPDYQTTMMPDGEIHIFDARSLHRATPVIHEGERVFFRMSMWHKPNFGEGQLSKQEQLYLLPNSNYQPPQIDSYLTERQPPPEVLATFDGQARISHLAEEQSVFGASLQDIAQHGGRVSKRLLSIIRDNSEFVSPKFLAPLGSKPVIDLVIFRLYPGYRPFFPNYHGNPEAVDLHMSGISSPYVKTAIGPIATQQPELWLTVSSHDNLVNATEFADGFVLNDGMLVKASAYTPRRQLPAENRGWRLMMRVRLVPENDNTPVRKITQQYVAPSSEDAGW